jgi:hypothetical protein
LIVAQAEGNQIPRPLLIVLIFWLAVLFGSFALLAAPNRTVVATLLISALSVAGAFFLILDLSGPFDEMLQLPSSPLRSALGRLAQ